MNKTLITALGLGFAAVFSAQAQNARDPADQSGYGAMPATTTTVPTVAAQPAAKVRLFAALGNRNSGSVDAIDQAAYGAMPAAGMSLRTRAEVRAEAIAARDADMDAIWREGGDPQYAILKRGRAMDTAHMVAGTAAKAAE